MSMPPMEAPSDGLAGVVGGRIVVGGSRRARSADSQVGCSAGRGVGIAGAGDSCDCRRRGFEVAAVDVGGIEVEMDDLEAAVTSVWTVRPAPCDGAPSVPSGLASVATPSPPRTGPLRAPGSVPWRSHRRRQGPRRTRSGLGRRTGCAAVPAGMRHVARHPNLGAWYDRGGVGSGARSVALVDQVPPHPQVLRVGLDINGQGLTNPRPALDGEGDVTVFDLDRWTAVQAHPQLHVAFGDDRTGRQWRNRHHVCRGDLVRASRCGAARAETRSDRR